MTETPHTFLQLLHIYNYLIKLNDLIINWKKSQQGLSNHNLDLYFLLDLSTNQLSGEIPDTLGTLKLLMLLNISHNTLYGKIPASLGDLKSLESLDLSHNKISSSIPQSLTKLQQLTVLDVSNNNLIGKIHVGGQMDKMNNQNFYANNSGLCGMQIRVSCQENWSPAKPTKIESRETWFSWEGIVIGYLVGLFVTVGSMYLIGYIVPVLPPNCC